MLLKQFYLLSLFVVSASGGLILFVLWQQIKLRATENRGPLFLSLALFSWTIVAILKYYDPDIPELINAINDRVLSAFSNLFLLASLPYFPGLFNHWKNRYAFFRKPDKWIINVFIFFTILTVLFTTIDRNIDSDASKKVIILVDSFISVITLALVCYAVYKTLTRFWNGTFLQLILVVLFTSFISTQFFLPLISIFPETLRGYYPYALVITLSGIVFLTYTAITSFAMHFVHVQMVSKDTVVDSLNVSGMHIGYKTTEKKYYVHLFFNSSGKNRQEFSEEIQTNKLLVPFANWILFAVARKKNVSIQHPDIAITKFRMVEFWNKNAEITISQELLFDNDRGFFRLEVLPENITINNSVFLAKKFMIRDAFIKHKESFVDQLNVDNEEELMKVLFDLE